MPHRTPTKFRNPPGFLGVVDLAAPGKISKPREWPMKDSEPFSQVDESQAGGAGYRAVQGDTAATCVDWQAFHCWQDGDPAFTGVVTVLNDHGGQQTMANWSSPTDEAADTSSEQPPQPDPLRTAGHPPALPCVLDRRLPDLPRPIPNLTKYY